VQPSSTATGYLIDPDDQTIPTIWQVPNALLINGELPIAHEQTQWSMTLPMLSPTWANSNYSAYLYFKGNSTTVPWVIDNTTGMATPTPIELPTSIVKVSPDTNANQTLLFTQSPVGQVVKSHTLAFGAYIE
jgi:hypothetical protein